MDNTVTQPPNTIAKPVKDFDLATDAITEHIEYVPFDRDLVIDVIKALESGSYKQTNNYLHTLDGYCCLGVMCDRVDASLWQREGLRLFVYKTLDDAQEVATVLPQSIYSRLAIDANGGRLDGRQWTLPSGLEFSTLAGVNDNGAGFDEIANLMRDYYGVTAEDLPLG